MVEEIVLGIVQGVTEWLPISSSGIIFLTDMLFDGDSTVSDMLRMALFFHIGTVASALVYFRKDFWELARTVLYYRSASEDEKKLLSFLVVSTLVTGVIGIIILTAISHIESTLIIGGRAVASAIGIFLVATAFFQLKAKGGGGIRGLRDLTPQDGVLLGIVQGLSVIPGLSRSGITISTLLLRKVNGTHALRLSFLMSVPVVLAANVLLNTGNQAITFDTFIGFVLSFAFGIATIHVLIKLSAKVNFAYFILIFGVLMIGAGLLPASSVSM